MSDPLVGITDGTNQTFSVSYDYIPGKIEVIYNGQSLYSSVDFEETGAKEITFIYLKPTDDTTLFANYEIGDCTVSGITVSSFLDLEDTPDSYSSHSGKILSVRSDEQGLSFIEPPAGNFIELIDTPDSYSGFEDYYLKVNSSGDGIEFVPCVISGSNIQVGIENIPSGSNTKTINFSESFNDDNYVIISNLENKLDTTPSVYPVLIKNKTASGFTVELSGETDSSNYYLNWAAFLPGSEFYLGSGGISSVSEDSTPSLGGNLTIGNHLMMLDTVPSGLNIHGYEVGYSGDASEMYVLDNPTGFACPLYMRSDGKWAACCAASGIYHMPCMALALEEDDGDFKKIFWKGNIRKSNWNWTPGNVIYVSTVEGALTNVEPNSGSWSQAIGLAISNDTIRFDPGFNPGKPSF